MSVERSSWLEALSDEELLALAKEIVAECLRREGREMEDPPSDE